MEKPAKIVFLVLAHRPEPFDLLMRLIGDRFDCFVHVDARVPLEPFVAVAASKTRFIEKRTPIFWCGSNMMLATLDLIRAAMDAVPDFDRLALISGDCLPAADLDTIAETLGNPDVEFIQTAEVQNDPTLRGLDPSVAVERYGWRQPARFQNFVYWDHELLNPRDRRAALGRYAGESEAGIGRLRGEIEAIAATILADLAPRPALFETFYYGSQWWAVSRGAMLAIADRLFSDEIRSYFKYFRVPDEHFIHCVFGNDPALKARARRPFMFSSHLLGGVKQRPYLEPVTLKAARAKGHLFARKFEPEAMPDIAVAILQDRYFAELEKSSQEPTETVAGKIVDAVHPHWTGRLILSETDNSVVHQGHGTRGTYRLVDGVLTVRWDKFEPDRFIERDGAYVHQRLASRTPNSA